MRMKLWLVVLAAAAFPVVAAANPGVSGIPLLYPSFSVAAANVSATAKAPDAPAADAALALTRPFVRRVGYRPRAYRSPMTAMPITAQFHVGFFDPIDNFSTGFDGGFRIGPQVDPHVQIGLAMDWWHRSDDEVLDLGKVEAPGGIAYEELILSESTANLVPILVFVQVSGDENMPVIPYAGFRRRLRVAVRHGRRLPDARIVRSDLRRIRLAGMGGSGPAARLARTPERRGVLQRLRGRQRRGREHRGLRPRHGARRRQDERRGHARRDFLGVLEEVRSARRNFTTGFWSPARPHGRKDRAWPSKDIWPIPR